MRLYLRSRDRRPDPAPLQTNDRATILVGIGVWIVVWIGCLVMHSRLADGGNGWWIWTPPTGIVLGVLGLAYLRRLSRPRPRRGGSDRAESGR
jgi:hypothetical protein